MVQLQRIRGTIANEIICNNLGNQLFKLKKINSDFFKVNKLEENK